MGPADHPRPDARTSWDDATWPSGWHVRHVVETGSTNADLLRAAAGDAPDRSVLAADHQTSGRGRLDRRWEAPPGANLLVSILFRDPPGDPSELTRRIGVAAVDAVERSAGVRARLKWPNDLLLEGRKLAGVLAEQALDGSVVVGIGINVGWAPEGAAWLDDGLGPAVVLAELLAAYDALPSDIHPRYQGLLDTIGRRVRVELPGSEVVGTAIAVERDGRLIVVDDCALSHRIGAGDVVHLRPV